MRITVQYFSKTGDRELDGVLRKALEKGGFMFVHKLLDKGGGSMDYVFENPRLADPDERVACIDCIQGTFKSRVDAKGRCLVCQQEAAQNPDVRGEGKKALDEEQGEDSKIIRKMVEAHLGDAVTFEYSNTNEERSEATFRKILSRIVSEKPIKEEDFSNNSDSPGRAGEDVNL